MAWTEQSPSAGTWTATDVGACRWVTLGTVDEQGDGGVDFSLTINNAAPWCVKDTDTWIVIRDDVTSENP